MNRSVLLSQQHKQAPLLVQTLLEHVVRDFRPDQRALKRLAALPGEENRTGFTNMIKVSTTA